MPWHIVKLLVILSVVQPAAGCAVFRLTAKELDVETHREEPQPVEEKQLDVNQLPELSALR